jgi:hypothetical protein
VHEQDRLLHGQRDAVGALVQEFGERRRHLLAVQHRGHKLNRLSYA